MSILQNEHIHACISSMFGNIAKLKWHLTSQFGIPMQLMKYRSKAFVRFINSSAHEYANNFLQAIC
jgi:hypothetical protein